MRNRASGYVEQIAKLPAGGQRIICKQIAGLNERAYRFVKLLGQRF